jgi:hypothetical protein
MELPLDSPDLTGVQLWGNVGTIRIINAYIDCNDSTALRTIYEWLVSTENLTRQPEGIPLPKLPLSHIILGDFNRHHPLWEDESNAHLFTAQVLRLTQPLLDTVNCFELSLALPKNILTLEHSRTKNWTRPDNVFVSHLLMNSIIHCDVDASKRPPKADHLPIITTLDIRTTQTQPIPKRAWCKTDWDLFKSTLELELATLGSPRTISSPEQMEQSVLDLEKVYLTAMDKAVLLTKPCPHTKRWWSPDLSKSCSTFQRLSCKSHKLRLCPLHPIHEEIRCAHNDYSQLIRTTKKNHWNDWLESAAGQAVWDINKFVNSTSQSRSCTCLPNLKNPLGEHLLTATTNEDKSRALHSIFFPPPAYNPPTLNEGLSYPDPVTMFRPITKNQIRRAVQKLHPHKATMEGDISNIALQKMAELVIPYLLHIYRATFTLNHYPSSWKKYDTVVLRKLNRADYTVPKAYRPIVLLNTMAKPLSMVVAKDITYILEKNNLLPGQHFGGRPGRTATNAIHLVTKFILDAWRSCNVISALFLDIKGAFPSIDIPTLQHEMRMRGLPAQYILWIGEKLRGRSTSIVFDDFHSGLLDILAGLDQGCSLSPICYIIYNDPALKTVEVREKYSMLASSFIDDQVFLAKARTFPEANAKHIMEKRDGFFEWACTHNCEIELPKCVLISFFKRTMPEPLRPNKRRPILRASLTISDFTIKPSKSMKFLGAILHQSFSWKEQTTSALAKGQRWATNVRRIT